MSASTEQPSGRLTLRRGGVYLLPDGTELVAGVCARGGRYFLYRPSVWRGSAPVLSMPVALEVGGQGEITDGAGRRTGWRVGDLADTGRLLER